MAIKNIKTAPYVGFERVAIAGLATDTKEEYAFSDVIEIVDGAVSMSFNITASENSFFSSNKKTASDFTYTPTGSIAYAGDSFEIDKLLFGKKELNGAVIENLGAAPEISVLGLMNTGDGWVIRHITKATAAKDDVTVSTKGESVTFTNPSATLSCMASTYFNAYTRDFYSANPAFEGKTAKEVFDALLADPMTAYTEAVGV